MLIASSVRRHVTPHKDDRTWLTEGLVTARHGDAPQVGSLDGRLGVSVAESHR